MSFLTGMGAYVSSERVVGFVVSCLLESAVYFNMGAGNTFSQTLRNDSFLNGTHKRVYLWCDTPQDESH